MSAEWPLADIAEFVLTEARRIGASDADVVVVEGAALSTAVRLGEIERVQRSRKRHLGLRVFLGNRVAVTSSAELRREALQELVEKSRSLAAVVAADPCAGLPDAAEVAKAVQELDLYDPTEVSPEEGVALATAAEAAARESDPRIANSEGAEFEWSFRTVVYASTLGFTGSYRTSTFSLSVVPVAAQDGGMQRDYWYAVKRRFAELDNPEDVGREAARRALRRLGARRPRTQQVPVIFEAEAAASLLHHLAAAVSGYSLYKGASFLLGKLGERIAPEFVTVVDDGTIPGALGSRPFDGEGVGTRRTVVIDRGVLASYLFDTYSARKLGARTTGNAVRPAGEAPHVGTQNFYLQPGSTPAAEIIRSTSRGLYVTELIGQGVNSVTGDYSRGAVGIWIEGGELAYPVEQITIAGTLLDMYRDIEAVGAEFEFRSAIAAPAIKIGRLTVAGD